MALTARSCDSVKSPPQIFAAHAPVLHQAGMAAVPLGAKDPLVAGFNRWKRRPTIKTVDKWREKFPSANIGYVPGLTGKFGTVVVDDDGGAADQIRDVFGSTPGIVQASRADHYLFRAPKGVDLRHVDLKKLGINADFKFGNSIVVAPGSVHKNGHVYSWRDCDERVLADLPELNHKRLEEFIRSKAAPGATTQAELRVRAGFRDASRKLQLNDLLYGRSRSVASEFELVAIGHKWNASLAGQGIVPLEDAQVVQIANAVWKDREAGKVEVWHGRGATVRSDLDEMAELARLSKNGSNAFFLLMKLRGEHGARAARDETFALNCVAMAKAGSIANWTRYDYEKARDVLLEAGKLTQVSKFSMSKNGWRAAQFRLQPFRVE